MSRTLPILFNTEMTKAILDNRKTMTRRPVKQKIKPNQEINKNAKGQFEIYSITPRCGIPQGIILKPPYEPGDTLYVRETWGWEPCWDCGMDTEKGGCGYEYERIYNQKKKEYGCYCYKASMDDGEELSVDTWHPSIHMPKAAARIWLEVTDVRAGQLKDITDKDAGKEGYPDGMRYGLRDTAAGHFLREFKTIYPTCTEDSWVWVIEFRRHGKPESEGMDGYIQS